MEKEEGKMKGRLVVLVVLVAASLLLSGCFPIDDGGDITVYITETGSKYHRWGCQYLRQSCIPISLREAKRLGYTPCKVCKPPS